MTWTLDTNIVIYAPDDEDRVRDQTARRAARHWIAVRRIVPRQVIGEILNLGHRRGGPRLDHRRTLATRLEQAAAIVDTRAEDSLAASSLAERYLTHIGMR